MFLFYVFKDGNVYVTPDGSLKIKETVVENSGKPRSPRGARRSARLFSNWKDKQNTVI